MSAFAAVTLGKINVGPVPPASVALIALRCQEYVSPSPVAATFSATVCPAATVALNGCPVITGNPAATVTGKTTCAALLFASAARTVTLAVPAPSPVNVSVLPTMLALTTLTGGFTTEYVTTAASPAVVG